MANEIKGNARVMKTLFHSLLKLTAKLSLYKLFWDMMEAKRKKGREDELRLSRILHMLSIK